MNKLIETYVEGGVRIQDGWCFYSADFSYTTRGKSDLGEVTLIRERSEAEKWYNLHPDVKCSDNCSPLFVSGEGSTLEEAIFNANLAAAKSKDVI